LRAASSRTVCRWAEPSAHRAAFRSFRSARACRRGDAIASGVKPSRLWLAAFHVRALRRAVEEMSSVCREIDPSGARGSLHRAR